MAFSYRKFNFYSNSLFFAKRQLSVSMTEAISKAELCLGYSVNDLSVKQIAFYQKIQALMNKEKSTVHSVEHPVLLAERKLDPEIEANYKSRALLTLLLAKVVSVTVPKQKSPQFKFNLNLNKSGSLTKHRLLAQTIELIYGGCVYHTLGVSPLNGLNGVDNIDDILEGNRLAVLAGDLMFSNATKNLINLKNSRVLELMGKALTDFIEGEYLCIKIKEQIESGDWTHILENWVRMTCLKSASLLANGCQSMIHLSNNCESLDECVYKFGNSVGFAWNVCEELDMFYRIRTNYQKNIYSNVYSLPILLHLNSNPELKQYLKTQNNQLFIKDITEATIKSDAINKTKSLIDFYSDNALDQINNFADSEAKCALTNIILALKQF